MSSVSGLRLVPTSSPIPITGTLKDEPRVTAQLSSSMPLSSELRSVGVGVGGDSPFFVTYRGGGVWLPGDVYPIFSDLAKERTKIYTVEEFRTAGFLVPSTLIEQKQVLVITTDLSEGEGQALADLATDLEELAVERRTLSKIEALTSLGAKEPVLYRAALQDLFGHYALGIMDRQRVQKLRASTISGSEQEQPLSGYSQSVLPSRSSSLGTKASEKEIKSSDIVDKIFKTDDEFRGDLVQQLFRQEVKYRVYSPLVAPGKERNDLYVATMNKLPTTVRLDMLENSLITPEYAYVLKMLGNILVLPEGKGVSSLPPSMLSSVDAALQVLIDDEHRVTTVPYSTTPIVTMADPYIFNWAEAAPLLPRHEIFNRPASPLDAIRNEFFSSPALWDSLDLGASVITGDAITYAFSPIRSGQAGGRDKLIPLYYPEYHTVPRNLNGYRKVIMGEDVGVSESKAGSQDLSVSSHVSKGDEEYREVDLSYYPGSRIDIAVLSTSPKEYSAISTGHVTDILKAYPGSSVQKRNFPRYDLEEYIVTDSRHAHRPIRIYPATLLDVISQSVASKRGFVMDGAGTEGKRIRNIYLPATTVRCLAKMEIEDYYYDPLESASAKNLVDAKMRGFKISLGSEIGRFLEREESKAFGPLREGRAFGRQPLPIIQGYRYGFDVRYVGEENEIASDLDKVDIDQPSLPKTASQLREEGATRDLGPVRSVRLGDAPSAMKTPVPSISTPSGYAGDDFLISSQKMSPGLSVVPSRSLSSLPVSYSSSSLDSTPQVFGTGQGESLSSVPLSSLSPIVDAEMSSRRGIQAPKWYASSPQSVSPQYAPALNGVESLSSVRRVIPLEIPDRTSVVVSPPLEYIVQPPPVIVPPAPVPIADGRQLTLPPPAVVPLSPPVAVIPPSPIAAPAQTTSTRSLLPSVGKQGYDALATPRLVDREGRVYYDVGDGKLTPLIQDVKFDDPVITSDGKQINSVVRVVPPEAKRVEPRDGSSTLYARTGGLYYPPGAEGVGYELRRGLTYQIGSQYFAAQ